MNAALGNTIPAVAQAHDANPRSRGNAAQDDANFREALDGERKAGSDVRAKNDAAQEKRPGLMPVRWTLPHAVNQASGRMPARQDAPDGGDGATEDVGTETPVVALPAGEERHDAQKPVQAMPEEAARADLQPARPEADNPEMGAADADAASGRSAPAAEPGARAASQPAAPAMPPAPPPAHERAPQKPAPAAVLNRSGGEAEAGAAGRAETMRERTVDNSGRPDMQANAPRPEIRPVNAAPEALPRDGQAEIRVLSIQRAPAPAASSDQTGTAGQQSAPAEAARTQSTTHSEAGRVLQTLKIQLHPAELGPVTARLRIVAEQLMVDIQVETAEARHRLGSDSDAIVKALRGLGYDIDRVTIQQATPGSPSNGAPAGKGGDGAFQSAAGGQGGDEQSHGAGQQNGREGAARNTSPAQDGGDASGGGLYI
ncbi:flagellar hook-length control protein FliK [Nitratireductor pacificus]|uniref:Flagellar hook-length control protein n=1 Tax=Nitratireductor pacificus pht-3B TaxID=391937 RepID=K2M898_9HYPH|nr:flagellar hook-length control protein FliK [Nitratireductor pacificus]EKF17140.1 flagellar hook-length control protein [Nitratireductor pacificus pht-3B]